MEFILSDEYLEGLTDFVFMTVYRSLKRVPISVPTLCI